MEQLTVIIPTRDRPQALERCLGSLAKHADARLAEVIVVNDGQQDICAACERSGLRTSLLILDTPSVGPGAARNRALKRVSTARVAFLDDDATPSPDWLEQCSLVFDNDPGVTAQLGRITWQRADESLPWQRRFVPRLRQKLYDTRHRLYMSPEFRIRMAEAGLPMPALGALGVAPHLSGGNASIRMAFIEEYGGFDERFYTFHDREMAYRILLHGGVVAYNPEMVIEHDHDPSIVRSLRRSSMSVPYAQMLRAMYESEPWWNIEGRSQSQSSEGTLHLEEPLTPTEQAFMMLQDGLKWMSGAWLRMFRATHGNAL